MGTKIKLNFQFNPYPDLPSKTTPTPKPIVSTPIVRTPQSPRPSVQQPPQPHKPAPVISNPVSYAPATPQAETKREIQQLEEFKQLLNDTTKNNGDLNTKFNQLTPHLKEILSKLVWVCHYKPNELGFGERLLRQNMRILLDMQNNDGVDLVSQLIAHYSTKAKAYELAAEVNGFVIAAGKFSNDKHALLNLFNGLSETAKNGLRHKVWYNHGGNVDPNFGGWNYGANKVQECVGVLWSNFQGTENSIVMHYLNELQNNRNFDDNAFISELSHARDLNKVYSTSTAPLENEPNLASALPKHLRAAFVTAELSGVASIGGLASALDGMVRGFGESDARVIMPLYENGPIKNEIMNHLEETKYEVHADGRTLKILKPSREVREKLLNGVHVYFIADPNVFWIPKKHDGTAGNLYEGEYHQVRRRWAVFQKGAAELAYQFSKKANPFELVHVQDAQTALVPKFLKEQHYDEWKRGETPTTVFTFHNNQEAMEYVDEQDTSYLASLGLPKRPMNSFMECLHDAEAVTTVSKQFAQEAQWEHSDFGKGMQRDVREIAGKGKLFGIVNGNADNWNPTQSKQLANWISAFGKGKVDLRFGPDMSDQQLEDKTKEIQHELCAYLRQLGPNHPAYADLDPEKPIVLYVNRYDSSQKGVEKLKLIMEETLANGGQFVCVGLEPDPKAKEILEEMKAIARKRNHKGVLVLEDRKENGQFVHQGVFGDALRAACTLFAVPSKFEPCGLVHSELLRYGKKIFGTKTGGLIDTVQTEGPNANGYLFDRKSFWGTKENPSHEQNEAIKTTLRRALADACSQQRALYHGPQDEKSRYIAQMRNIMRNALDTTWEATADGSLSAIRLYELVYAKAFQNRKKRGKINVDLKTMKI